DRVVNLQVRPRKIMRRSEVLLPVTVAHERDRRRPLLVIARGEIPAGDRLDSAYREKRRRYRRHPGARRLGSSGNRDWIVRALGDGLKAMGLIAKVVKVRISQAREPAL